MFFKTTEAVDQLSLSSADQPLAKPPSPRPRFSSVSKSLVMTRGLTKLRKRLTTDDKDAKEFLDSSPPGDNTKKKNLSPVRRVQFDETSFNQKQDVNNDGNEYVFIYFIFLFNDSNENLIKYGTTRRKRVFFPI